MNLEILGWEVGANYVLVVFPKNENLDRLLQAIVEAGDVPLICHSFEEAQEVLKYENIHTIICEDHLPKKSLEGILKLARNLTEPVPVIITSRTGEWEEFLAALQLGAFDYLSLPPRLSEVKRVLQLAMAEAAHTQTRAARAGMASVMGSFEDRWRGALDQDRSVAANHPVTIHKIH